MTAARYIPEDMQALLDAAVDAVILIDHLGRMLVVNRSTERLFGYTQDDMIGQNVTLLMPEAERRAHDGYIQRYIESGEPHVIGRGREVMAVRRDGSSFPAHLSVGAVPGANPPRFAGFVHDLTEQREADAEVRLSQERLSQVARFASLGEMAAGISHELNQPLAAIATYAQASDRLLAAPVPDLAATQDALRQIAAQALRAGEIIRRLRHLVSDRKTEHQTENLNEVVQEVAALAANDARHHGVMLRFVLTPGLAAVNVDRVQIQQVLLNLVRNAIEALGDLPPARRHIVIGTLATGEREAEAYVRDLGPGITAEDAARMFDPFFTTKETGTGLGLAISRTIARAHQGQLGYRPNSPFGAEFFLRLPTLEP
jgi:two-component system sensor kinase FixL